MIDDLRIGKAILEEKLAHKMQQVKYYKYKAERLEETLKEIEEYVDKMSYCEVVDNPKKDLIKILKKENK